MSLGNPDVTRSAPKARGWYVGYGSNLCGDLSARARRTKTAPRERSQKQGRLLILSSLKPTMMSQGEFAANCGARDPASLPYCFCPLASTDFRRKCRLP